MGAIGTPEWTAFLAGAVIGDHVFGFITAQLLDIMLPDTTSKPTLRSEISGGGGDAQRSSE